MSSQWNDSLLEEAMNLSSPPPSPSGLNLTADETSILYPLSWVIPVTVVYGIIFITGLIGNVSTCVVISCNKSMHTATNYYLFSLAISDLLLLISGLPPEMYRLWSPETYVFGEAFCVLQGFAAETSANATVLTITAFTVERYVAICHPFLSHTMSKLSRAVRYIVVIWVVALCLAAPQAIQFGMEYEMKGGVQHSRCTVVTDFFHHAFEISTFLFFVGPMTLITVLYILIGLRLRKSRQIVLMKRVSISGSAEARARSGAAQNRVVNMLIAVVAAFFICWAPFHAQRLFAVYLSNSSQETQQTTITIYMVLMHASGILYFLSTTINPVLYHIMSNKFRDAFKKTLTNVWMPRSKRSLSQTYSVLTKCSPLDRKFQRSVSDGVANHTLEERVSFRVRMRGESSNTSNRRPVVVISGPTIPLSSLDKPRVEKKESGVRNEQQCNNISHRVLTMFSGKRFAAAAGHFFRHNSVDSSHTISNSSLQDVEEMDYSSSDLVRYMEEVNEDIA